MDGGDEGLDDAGISRDPVDNVGAANSLDYVGTEASEGRGITHLYFLHGTTNAVLKGSLV